MKLSLFFLSLFFLKSSFAAFIILKKTIYRHAPIVDVPSKIKNLTERILKAPSICKDKEEQNNPKVLDQKVTNYINSHLYNPGPGLCKNLRNRKKRESLGQCYKRAQGNFLKLQKTIFLAAKEFSLNPNHLACLILQESQFLENARSSAGAFGIAQFTKGSVDARRVILASRYPAGCKRPRKRVSSFCETKKEMESKKDNLTPRWEKFVSGVEANENIHLGNKICKKGQECRKNMYWGVGAAALYLREIIDFSFTKKERGAQSEVDTFLMGNVLYNTGPNAKKEAFWKLNLNKKLQGEWERKLTYKQPKKYVKRIRKCILGL